MPNPFESDNISSNELLLVAYVDIYRKELELSWAINKEVENK
jgi:hypothetical protein